MKYTVVWLPSAEDELTDIWNKATDKQAVADSANRLDLLLKHDAENKGRDFNSDRILTIQPLTFVFSVSSDDCMVTVLQVFRTS